MKDYDGMGIGIQSLEDRINDLDVNDERRVVGLGYSALGCLNAGFVSAKEFGVFAHKFFSKFGFLPCEDALQPKFDRLMGIAP